jgi:hypothetical protein
VEQDELLGETHRVRRTGLLGKVPERCAHPGAVVVGDILDAGTRRRFGTRGDEGAATEVRLGERPSLDLEDPEQTLARRERAPA